MKFYRKWSRRRSFEETEGIQAPVRFLWLRDVSSRWVDLLELAAVPVVLTLLFLVLVLLSCAPPTGPDNLVEPWIQEEFSAAAAALAERGLDVGNAHAYDFRYIEAPTLAEIDGCGVMRSLGGELVYGQFAPPRNIYYASQCRRVVRHELGHAVLYANGDPWYFCWQHRALKDAGEKRFQACPEEYL